MQEKIRQIIIICVVLVLLLIEVCANALGNSWAVNFNDVTTQESSKEGQPYASEEQIEQDIQPTEMPLPEESDIITQEDIKRMNEITRKLNSAENLIMQITSTYSEENVNIEKQISEILEEVERILECYPKLENSWERYNSVKEEFERYKQMIQSIAEKMEAIQISNNTDMSQIYGFTEEEFVYILKNVRGRSGKLIIKDALMAENVAKGIVEAMSEYPVNELFVVSVMSFETGYFKSTLAVKYNNFGGMLKATGVAYHFGTSEEGIRAAVRCIYSNLKGNNTANDVNETYCAPHILYDENGEPVVDEDGNPVMDVYYWARNVLSIMKTYANAISNIK